MKSLIKGLMVASLLVTLASTAAFANTKQSTIVLSADTKVNDMLVKKGTYKAVFDDQSNELSIVKGGKVVAKTTARLAKRDQKARSTEIQTVLDGMDQKLVAIAFSGSHENVVVSQTGMQAGGN